MLHFMIGVSSYAGAGMLLNRLFFAILAILFHIAPGFTTDIPDDTAAPLPLTKQTRALDVNQTKILHRAEAGDIESQVSMAKFYYEQKDVKDEAEGNRIEAAKWLKLATAKEDHAEALYLLGKCHCWGFGVPLNTVLGVIYYLRSAKLNFAPAQYDVAKCYYTGACVTPDRAIAIRWCTAAAEQGLISAEFFLGRCYFTGQGVAPNRTEAYKWCMRAAAKDHEIGTIAKRYIKKNRLQIR